MTLAERATRFLSSRRATVAAFVVATVLGLATFAIGFYSDDWALIAALEHKVPGGGTPLDLYRFGAGDPVETVAGIARGPWPWWTLPELRLHFFRPLASAFFTLDYALFHHAAAGYHLDALAWWIALVVIARAFLRRALPVPAAALALLLFVADDGHVQPIGWISSRHMLVAAVPALGGFVAHRRWRETRRPIFLALSLAGLAAGLLGGEAAFGALAYWIAYELVGSRDTRAVRAAALAPALGLAMAYLVAYKAFGFGASGSGMYFEPFSDPIGFVLVALTRVPILVGDLLLSISAELSNIAPRGPFVAMGLVGAAFVGWLGWRSWPDLDTDERASVRWLALGALLGSVVGLAGYPGSRVLLLPSVGAFGVLGLFIERALFAGRVPAPSGSRKTAAVVLLFVHGVAAPLQFLGLTAALSGMARETERVADVPLRPPLPKRVYVLISSDPLAAFYAGATRAVRRGDEVAAMSILSMAKHTHRVTRTGPASLRLETLDGTLFDGGFVDVCRSRRFPIHAGDVFAMDRATVRVLADRDGAPTAIDFTIDVPFEDPTIEVMAWQTGALRDVVFAKVDSPLEIPWSPGPTGLF